MKLKPILILSLVLALAVTAGLPFVLGDLGTDISVMAPTEPGATVLPTGAPTQPETEPATEPPTDPAPVTYTLSFVGDCTLGCTEGNRPMPESFIGTVGDDYDYPLANVRAIFQADDFTLANLEGPLTEDGIPMEKEFVFRGPPAYAAILSGSGVEAVTNSNNHFYDYGEPGMASTRQALDEAGITHGWRGSFLYTTDSGLTIGVYCDDFSFERAHMENAFADLRAQGAEVIVCAFHWGEEKAYTPSDDQILWAHIAIDAGADIVAGHHPHVLQPMEYYGGGVIFYSLGNFCYGGSMHPHDRDTAIVQQQFVRDPGGAVTMGETVVIPCCVSSAADRNNYQPTPYEAGSDAWNRVMEKLAPME